MCFSCEMRDIVPAWYLEDLLLAYMNGMKSRFCRDLEALKPFINRFTYLVLADIAENSIVLK